MFCETKIILKHIDDIKVGDTIIQNSQMKTISKTNIIRDSNGRRINGDSYMLGTKLVKVVLFKQWYQGKCIGYK